MGGNRSAGGDVPATGREGGPLGALFGDAQDSGAGGRGGMAASRVMTGSAPLKRRERCQQEGARASGWSALEPAGPSLSLGAGGVGDVRVLDPVRGAVLGPRIELAPLVLIVADMVLKPGL